jgi:hypothetical protein
MNLETTFEPFKRKQMIADMNRDQLLEVCTMLIDENHALKSGMKMIPDLLQGMLEHGTTEAFSGGADELDEWVTLLSLGE